MTETHELAVMCDTFRPLKLELQTLLDRLERKGLLDVGVLHQAMRRADGTRGMNKLTTALEPFTTIPDAEYLSLLERFTVMVLRPAGFTDYEVNGKVTLPSGHTIRIDILLRRARVAIEVDGRDAHNRTLQFGTDRWRDRELQKIRFRPLRFPWQDVMHRPQQVLRDIRDVL
jgi:very-short-patch-repair endonuclease